MTTPPTFRIRGAHGDADPPGPQSPTLRALLAALRAHIRAAGGGSYYAVGGDYTSAAGIIHVRHQPASDGGQLLGCYQWAHRADHGARLRYRAL
jgi:hypothetical protein